MARWKMPDSMAERAAWRERVIAERKRRGMNQEELAAAAMVSRGTIQGLEAGRSIPQPEKMKSILDALGLLDDPADGWTRQEREAAEATVELYRGLSPAEKQAWLTGIARLAFRLKGTDGRGYSGA
jgi:transcriptional regulator with XRE-family HTH domain